MVVRSIVALRKVPTIPPCLHIKSEKKNIMASTLSELTNKSVTLLTCDGRLITGTLLGYDQLQNLILKQSYEKVYSMEAPVEKVELGLFVVRGDNVAVISEVTTADDGKDEDVRAEPIPPIVQNVT